jgi:tetratricopeptide (TPR) repeat protein
LIYSQLHDDAGRARVEYYRGRLLRHFGELNGALEAAAIAVELARASNERVVIGAALNGYGNVLRSLERFDDAALVYDEALAALSGAGDEEMTAVVRRNRGRLALELGQPEAAVQELEAALDAFAALALAVEEAQAALHHARAIAALGEIEEAEFELATAAERLRALGSKLRGAELTEARMWIEGCRSRLLG